MLAKDRLIVALDVPTFSEAMELVNKLQGEVGMFKIGLQLILTSSGIQLAQNLVARRGQKVFLDAKILDIATTVMNAVESADQVGAFFTTVHAYAPAMRAAVAVKREKKLNVKLLGVTVLTSLTRDDLRDVGYRNAAPSDLVIMRTSQAIDLGMDGVVCSPLEIEWVELQRKHRKPEFLIVTPGIRPEGADANDQARAATPKAAILAGADYLVVGRPITQSQNPAMAARLIVAEISQAQEERENGPGRAAEQGVAPPVVRER